MEHLEKRIAGLRARLESRPEHRACSWYSPNVKGGLARLENSFLVVCGQDSSGCFAARLAGTLERNSVNQQRILFSNSRLVRIRTGGRCNMVVRPENLREGETGVPAGINKRLACGAEPEVFSPERAGDMLFLDRLEALFRRPALELARAPEPGMFKLVRRPDQVTPRLTGELVRLLRAAGAPVARDPAEELFAKHYRSLSVEHEGSLLFSFSLVSGGGLTVLDLSTLEELYWAPAAGLSSCTEFFRVEFADPSRKPR